MVQRKPLSDLIGKRFFRYVVTAYNGKRKHGKHWWTCLCECGNEFELNTSRITGKHSTKSCGCLRKELLVTNRSDPTRHGLSTHPLYAVYHGMMGRCYNPNSQRYKYYGAKGVVVEWGSFLSFYEWAVVNGYERGLSIDRIDPDGNYCPDNCEWVTISENSRRMNDFRRNEKATAKGAAGNLCQGDGGT